MNEPITPSAIIMFVLDEVGKDFPDETVDNVRELVECNESGIALEVLCTQIVEYGVRLSNVNSSRLMDAARLMDIPLSSLDGLID